MPVYSERIAGIYRCTYMGCVERQFTNADSGMLEDRFIWRFQEVGDLTTVGQIDKITGTSLQSGNSNAHKMASGIVGRKLQPGDDTELYIGQVYDVVYGPNQAGNLTITSVVKVTGDTVRMAEAVTPAKAAELHAVQEGEELPTDGEPLPF
jgi:hypothetical protein